MMQVLWLASWYPNREEPDNGDFIQRHAIATSAFCNVHVIHVQLVQPSFQKQKVVVESRQLEKITETVIYLRRSVLAPPLNKIANQLHYEKQFKHAVLQYIKQNNLPHLVHVHIPIKSGKIALWIQKKWGIKYLLSEHYGIYNDHAPDKFSTRSAWYKKLTKKIIDEAAAFLPVSKNLGNAINQRVTTKPFEAVYNVVDTTIFNYQPNHHNDTIFWFIHASIMNHPKNPEGLLRAFSKALEKNKNLKLRMVGRHTQSIIDCANNLGLSQNVVFTGMLPQQEVAHLLQHSNAFVLFSNYENMPCAITEALCYGLPVISSDVGGIAEIINQQNGLLVKAGDEDALADAMLQIYNNRSQYHSQQIAKDTKGKFGYEEIGRQIFNVYQRVIKS